MRCWAMPATLSTLLQALGDTPAARPLQALHALYAQRLEHLLDQPPEGWDGIFTATSK